jgi:shikimate kinase
MATGKTTVGKLLSDCLGWRRVDTDEQIEATQGRSVKEVFKQNGEAIFREMETEVLEQLLALDQVVITTGGGIVLKELNRKLLRNNSYVIALTASEKAIIERVLNDQSRPLLQGDIVYNVKNLLNKRQGLYEWADLVIDTSNLDPQQVAKHVMARLP